MEHTITGLATIDPRSHVFFIGASFATVAWNRRDDPFFIAAPFRLFARASRAPFHQWATERRENSRADGRRSARRKVDLPIRRKVDLTIVRSI